MLAKFTCEWVARAQSRFAPEFSGAKRVVCMLTFQFCRSLPAYPIEIHAFFLLEAYQTALRGEGVGVFELVYMVEVVQVGQVCVAFLAG